MNKFSLFFGLSLVALILNPLAAKSQTTSPLTDSSVNNLLEASAISQESTSIRDTNLEASKSAVDLYAQQEVIKDFKKGNVQIAQQDIDLGRLTREYYGYLGIGINIGLDDDTSQTVGDTGFVLFSKLALNPNLSLRPSVIVADEVGFLLPLTYDITVQVEDPYQPSPIVPYFGGGLAVTTGDFNTIGFLITGGVDIRLSDKIVANTALNIGLMEDETELGLNLGIGYILPK